MNDARENVAEPAYLRATRAAYDTVAADYAALLRTELAGKPLDRALLGAFAELVRADGNGTVADLGCGPGRVTAYFARTRDERVRRRPLAGDGRGGPPVAP